MPSIFLVFTTNPEEFNITFRAVSIGTAEAEGVGFFINSSAIAHSSRATEGKRKVWRHVSNRVSWHCMMEASYICQNVRTGA